MATVSEPRGTFDAAATGRRVRHPLDSLRGHIRRYVLLEGLAVAVIYLALCFWAGLALDYGLFKIFAFDWVQEFQQFTVDPATGSQGNIDTITRAILLAIFLGGLAAVVLWKVMFRILREFSDTSLALVLERRFPQELGDRLITAVELADPTVAEKYGFSKTMVENTIRNAADQVEKVPVKEVFDWARLRVLGLWCVILTVGMYVAVGLGTSAVNAVFNDDAGTPEEYFWSFNDTAAIWTERNVLLMNSYWPRRAYLEIIRFQDTPAHRGEMRVGRNEQRPDLQIRAIQWVVADRAAPDGWRALRWQDLERFLDKNLLDKVAIPQEWGRWLVDLDDLDPAVPSGILPSGWQGMTVGDVRKDLSQPALADSLKKAQALPAAHNLLDWKTWTLDKIQLQENRGDIRRALRQEHPQAHQALEKVFHQVEELAADASYSRTLRRLTIPKVIQVYYRGETKKTDQACSLLTDNKYSVGLNDITESGRFTALGEDYYTPYKKITLVPPPAVDSLNIDKEEPAYIYYRVQGDQAALKGKKQFFYGYPISVMGDTSIIQVPYGTNLVIHARMDRPLKDGIRMRAPLQAEDRAAAMPHVPVVLDAQGRNFTIDLGNVVKPYKFLLEFIDQDNVKGRRELHVLPADDRQPDVLDTELEAVLRKPRYQNEPGKPNAGPGPGMDGFLITPDALLPFKGTLRDDYGLTAAAWVHEVEQVEFELIGQSQGDKVPTMVLQGGSQVVQASLVAGFFQVLPGTPSLEMCAPVYWTFMARLLRANQDRPRTEGTLKAPLEGFQQIMEARSIYELSKNDLEQKIKDFAFEQKRRQQALEEKKTYVPDKRLEMTPLFREYTFKEEDAFDLRRQRPRLKALDPTKEAQLHYLLKLSVEAVDNNVETGPGKGSNKAPFTFLVVSENELLGQIAFEEEALRDRLDKADSKLRDAKKIMDEQVLELSQPGPLYSLVSIRVDEVRKALLDAGTAAREIHTDYRRILRELEVNRVKRAKVDEVRDKIVVPLGEIVHPGAGNFVTTEAAVERLLLDLDLEQDAKRVQAKPLEHAGNAQLAARELDRLLQSLNDVLSAMDLGVSESKALQTILNIERGQRQIAEKARRIYNQKVDDLFQDLTK